MSIFFLLFLIGVIINIVRAVLKHSRTLPPSRRQPEPQRPASDKRPAAQQQSAYEWAFSQPRARGQDDDPEGVTREWAADGDDEERIHSVQPTVRDEISELPESQREIVHATVHETVHVHRPYSHEATPHTQKKAALASLQSRQDVARAVVLSEILGEPRAKRPWRAHMKSNKK